MPDCSAPIFISMVQVDEGAQKQGLNDAQPFIDGKKAAISLKM
jgi:hypothetical protein